MSKRSRTPLSSKMVESVDSCKEFKEHCNEEEDSISGVDWCDVPEKYYIRKGTLYPTQQNCHNLESLIQAWESALSSTADDWPEPRWPFDPYNRMPISVSNLIKFSAEWISHGNKLPEKLGRLMCAIFINDLEFDDIILGDKQSMSRLEGTDGLLFEILYPQTGQDIYTEQALQEQTQEARATQESEQEFFVNLLKDILSRKDLIIQDLLDDSEFLNFKEILDRPNNPITLNLSLNRNRWNLDNITSERMIEMILPNMTNEINLLRSPSFGVRSNNLNQTEKRKLSERLSLWFPRILNIVKGDIDNQTLDIAIQLRDALSESSLFDSVVSQSDLENSWQWLNLAIFDGLTPGLFSSNEPIGSVTESFAQYLLGEIPGITDQSAFKWRVKRTLSRIISNYSFNDY